MQGYFFSFLPGKKWFVKICVNVELCGHGPGQVGIELNWIEYGSRESVMQVRSSPWNIILMMVQGRSYWYDGIWELLLSQISLKSHYVAPHLAVNTPDFLHNWNNLTFWHLYPDTQPLHYASSSRRQSSVSWYSSPPQALSCSVTKKYFTFRLFVFEYELMW
jgi:hypothetical protein